MRNFPGKDALRPWVLTARRVRSGILSLNYLAYGHPSFSQFGEDRVLEQLFHDQPSGFFVDVGAYHPVFGSNTYLLYQRGWRGINLEPDPVARATIERSRPQDVTLPFAVSEFEGTVDFLVNGSFSGIDDTHYLWGREGVHIRVDSLRLATILAEHVPDGVRIDLLDVDCEGHDLSVLQSNDWHRFRPRVILAEWHSSNEIPDYLGGLGYTMRSRLRLTGVFTAEDWSP